MAISNVRRRSRTHTTSTLHPSSSFLLRLLLGEEYSFVSEAHMKLFDLRLSLHVNIIQDVSNMH